ncbi:MAG: peptidyl-prolyl cis-trans isomerase [Candidatus Aminicenantes bacterium]|nr:peptidyl-prolyl cis-trans isomerase [Candidatus Aminicenantes bacterium]
MKHLSLILVFVSIFSAGGFLCSQEVVEEIVAIVNDEIITLSKYKERFEMQTQALRSQLQGEEFERQYSLLKKELLDLMISDMLLLQEARKKGFDVTEQVRMGLEKIKEENGLTSDEELRRALAQQGLTYEKFVEQMRNQYLTQNVIFDEVNRNIVVDDAEIVKYYRENPEEFRAPAEYRLSAVFLSTEEKSDGACESLKKEINEKLTAGEDFAEVAKQYTDGPGKDSGGDLGTYKKGELDKTLETAVEGLAQGEISDWVKHPNGWFLLKLVEKKESRLKTFEEIKQEVERRLFNEKSRVKFEEYMKDLRKRSYIKILKEEPWK